MVEVAFVVQRRCDVGSTGAGWSGTILISIPLARLLRQRHSSFSILESDEVHEQPGFASTAWTEIAKKRIAWPLTLVSDLGERRSAQHFALDS
jgi:hypothetical protein